MIFALSIDGIQWSLDFGPDSVTLNVKDLVQEMTKISQEVSLTVWSLLLSQRQDFLNNVLVQFPLTPNQEGTLKMRDKVPPSVGAQDMDNSGYQVSNLDDADFYWENDQLDKSAVFRPGIDTPFSPSTFKLFEMGSKAENAILIDEEQVKKKPPPPTDPTTPVSERPTRLPLLMKSRPFPRRIEIVPDYVE